jgi:sugar phosphate isomerase/epimerase
MPAFATQLIVFNGHVNLETDPDTVFAAARAAGFTAVETQLTDAKRLRERHAAHGLKHAAAHVVAGQLQEPQPWIDYLGITEARDICSSGLLHWHQRTQADHDATIDTLNAAGRALRAGGIYLHYHNHDFELLEKPVSGVTTLQYLMDRLDPAAVDFCIDVGWLHRAGIDPARFLGENAARIGYLHLKDWNGRAWVPPGQGQVDLLSVARILPQLKQARWITCEQDDTPGDPAACLRAAGKWCALHLDDFS